MSDIYCIQIWSLFHHCMAKNMWKIHPFAKISKGWVNHFWMEYPFKIVPLTIGKLVTSHTYRDSPSLLLSLHIWNMEIFSHTHQTLWIGIKHLLCLGDSVKVQRPVKRLPFKGDKGIVCFSVLVCVCVCVIFPLTLL